jgi:transposase
MNDREQRGLAIAATCKITKKGGVYLVPSQFGKGQYTVCPDATAPHCSCPDHELRGGRCKHIFAVEFFVKREQNPDGTETVVSTVTVTEKVRKTYAQDWPKYNEAQTNEKAKFLSLLRDLCSGIQEPPPAKTGRPRIPLCDALFAACFKVYSTISARRFMTDLRDAQDKGFIGKAPCYNSIFNCLEDEAITPILKAMIVESSLPLKTVEVDFATDSSGFSTSRFVRWFDHKYGKVRAEHHWVKCHLTCGVKTNIVTAVVIKDKDAHDCPLLPEMLETTKENFTIRDWCGDKGYTSYDNFDKIDAAGGTPFISFKSNANADHGGVWAKMFHYFSFRRQEFLDHYHKRSNVESTFSMMKRKFGDSLRSKSDAAMVNEVLAKVVCHNIVCLIHEMYELGIEPMFWTETETPSPVAQKLPELPTNSLEIRGF